MNAAPVQEAVAVRGFGPPIADFAIVQRARQHTLPFGTVVLPSGVGLITGSIADVVRKTALAASTTLSLQLQKEINDLVGLKANWDGEGAKAVKMPVLADAIETLKRLGQSENGFQEPFLVPTFDGYVQMEWHGANRSLDIEAVEDGWIAVGTSAKPDGQREYFTAEFERSDFAQLARFYRWQFGIEQLWPSP